MAEGGERRKSKEGGKEKEARKKEREEKVGEQYLLSHFLPVWLGCLAGVRRRKEEKERKKEPGEAEKRLRGKNGYGLNCFITFLCCGSLHISLPRATADDEKHELMSGRRLSTFILVCDGIMLARCGFLPFSFIFI